MTLLEIEWKGPYSIEEIGHLNTDIDYGIYQIYGTHNILGADTLLYVGQACGQKFAHRLPQHNFIDWDFPEFRIYIGRLGNFQYCSEQVWSNQIDYAEMILIDHCQPPYNSKLLNGLSGNIPNDINILNFGKRHKLPFTITTSWRLSSHHGGQWKPYSELMNSSQQNISEISAEQQDISNNNSINM